MKRIFIIILGTVFIGCGISKAQTLNPGANPSDGGYYSNGVGSLSWTLGQSASETFTGGGNMLSQQLQQPEIDVITGSIAGGPFCPGASISVPFYTDGFVDLSNIFTAQLSDANGNFSSAINIGTIGGTATSGTISAVIPTGTSSGNGYLIRVISSAPVFTGKNSTTTLAIISCGTNTWLGNSIDWFTPSNWSTGIVPSSCSDSILIPTGLSNYPTLSANAQCGAITLQDGSNINLQTYNLTTCGNWYGPLTGSAIITGSGLVLFNGTSVQSIEGRTSMPELKLSNTSGATLQYGAILNIYTALDLASGNFDATNGTLTFKSTSTTHAAILDNFSSGYTGTLTPTATVKSERYYSTSLTYDQHFMGSPVNSPALSQFGASGTPGFVTPEPNCDETRLAGTSVYGTVFTYHESNGASCAEAQWKVETSGTAQNGLGYSILRAGTGTLTLSGTANLNSSYTVSNLTNSGWSNTSLQGRPYDAGWQLVANPYQATIVIDPTLNQGSFDAQVQVWDVAAGHYILTNTIAPFQAFMVHKTSAGGTASYIIAASERTRNAGTFHQLSAEQLTVVATNNTTGLADQIIVGFNQNATDSFDSQLDANKLPGNLDRHTLYSVNRGKWMENNILHDIAGTSTVPVGFEPGKTGNFTLSFNNVNTFDPTSYIYLEDRKQNVMYNVRNGDYNFTADSADNWNRFVLHFTPAAQIATTDGNCSAAGNISIQQPGTANWNYSLTDVNNATITTGTLNQNQPVTVSVNPGTYTLTLTDTNNYVAVKTIVVNGAEMISSAFNISRDIVQTGQTVALNSTTTSATAYNWDLGNGTNATGQNVTVSYATAGTYTVNLNVTNQSGCSSSISKTITVTDATATGLGNVTGTGNVSIWSHNNTVYVDFTDLQKVDATVTIYNILGQQISSDRVSSKLIYYKIIENIASSYFIIMVRKGNDIISKKVFLDNSK